MFHFLHILIIALANNLDNIGVRFAYSIRGIMISTRINLWISAITFVISYGAAYSGTAISGYLDKRLCSVLAMLILTAIGTAMIGLQYLKKACSGQFGPGSARGVCLLLPKSEAADLDHSKRIDFREATLLGIALSLNNVGGGLSAGMIGLSAFWIGLLSAVMSFLALWAGNHAAAFFIRWNLANKATVLAGILLIAIGIEQVL